ncbi:VCBS domain-containing protein [Paramagnetospirillum magneticum]|uniref:VCBS domain-containing protein n=1 Tax=Paramagnetospirillum magneticum TaxID=84159 RepID=UPI00187D3490|nr:VCBS domain-containing protein [Paramagnetospirillum magneticum]
MTINGANDSATISGSTTGAVAEDGNGRATGTLNVADVDHGQAHVTAQTVQTDQGTFSIGENGQWTFQVNSGNADVQALGAGESMTKTFAVASADGTATQNVTVTINGGNDSATISGSTTGSVAEDGNGRATGTLSVADVDHGQAHVTAQTVQTDQGTFSIGENGQWTFQVNSANADVQALGAGESMTKTFAVASADGTATQNVSVTITGSNDGPTVSGAVGLGHTAEDNSVTFTKAQLLANAHDTDAHDTLSVSNLSAAHGSIVDNGNGTYTFTPTETFSGHVDVSYTVSDGHGGTTTGSAALDVDAVADRATVSVAIGAPVETPNGSFTVTNLDSTASAGYNNTYGYYVMDDSGNPTSGGVIWSNVHASPGASVTISGVDPDRVGFFLIPDGGSQNSLRPRNAVVVRAAIWVVPRAANWVSSNSDRARTPRPFT